MMENGARTKCKATAFFTINLTLKHMRATGSTINFKASASSTTNNLPLLMKTSIIETSMR